MLSRRRRSSDDPPAVSPDGLHLVKNTEFALVYVKPGASLKPYTKFAILDCYVSFAPNWRENMQTQLQHSDHRRSDQADRDGTRRRIQEGIRCATRAGRLSADARRRRRTCWCCARRSSICTIAAPQDMADPERADVLDVGGPDDDGARTVRLGDESAARPRGRSGIVEQLRHLHVGIEGRQHPGRRRDHDEVVRYAAALHGGRAAARNSSAQFVDDSRARNDAGDSSGVVALAAAMF